MKKFIQTFIKNRWHLHSLTFVICWFMLSIIRKHPSFMDLGYSGRFLQGFLCVGCSAGLAFIVEWIQGAFYGANRTPEERRASNWDMIISTIAGTLAMIIFFLTHKV